MNRLILCTLIIFPFVFSSCDKKIEGTVFDNFGKPLKDVEVSIHNTTYEATTNSSGNYGIDYTAGEVIIKFQKEGYLRHEDALYITEKNTYPLKDIKLYKKPKESGIFIASNELSDYIKLKNQKQIVYKDIKRPRPNSRAMDNVTEFYLINRDSLVVIKLSSLDDVKIYHHNLKKHLLGKVGIDNKIVDLAPRGFYVKPYPTEPIKEYVKDVSESLKEHRMTLEFDVDYVYIFEDSFTNPKKYQPQAFIFRFEEQ